MRHFSAFSQACILFYFITWRAKRTLCPSSSATLRAYVYPAHGGFLVVLFFFFLCNNTVSMHSNKNSYCTFENVTFLFFIADAWWHTKHFFPPLIHSSGTSYLLYHYQTWFFPFSLQRYSSCSCHKGWWASCWCITTSRNLQVPVSAV